VKVIIDGRFVLDEPDLHRRMAGAFGYGPCYHHDLDSLCERLTAGDPRPLQLTWIHAACIRMAVGAAIFDKYVAVLEQVEAQDAGKEWSHRFVFRLFD
jgi:RNAse (barnase) inhibitor barstar